MKVPYLSIVREEPTFEYGTNSLLGPDDVVGLVGQITDTEHRECFIAIALDVKHRVLGVHVVSIGTLDRASVHPREVFLPMIMAQSAACIVAHNHLSGDPQPSAADRKVTDRLKDAGKLLGIQVLEHIIVCPKHIYSFCRGEVTKRL